MLNFRHPSSTKCWIIYWELKKYTIYIEKLVGDTNKITSIHQNQVSCYRNEQIIKQYSGSTCFSKIRSKLCNSLVYFSSEVKVIYVLFYIPMKKNESKIFRTWDKKSSASNRVFMEWTKDLVFKWKSFLLWKLRWIFSHIWKYRFTLKLIEFEHTRDTRLAVLHLFSVCLAQLWQNIVTRQNSQFFLEVYANL